MIEITEKKENVLNDEIKEAYGKYLKGLEIENENREHLQTRESRKDTRWTGGRKQWFRVQKCNYLRKNYEKENNIKYDIVIKSRPDLVFSNKLDLADFHLNKTLLEQTVFLLRHDAYPKIKIYDQFAFGFSDVMDFYCDLYDFFEDYGTPGPAGFKSEHQLYDHLDSREINIIPINPMLRFGMIRGRSKIDN